MSCCNESNQINNQPTPCGSSKKKHDYLLLASGSIISVLYVCYFVAPDNLVWIKAASASVHDLVNIMWWSMLLAVLFVGILSRIPQQLIISTLGKGGTWQGLFRAALAGVALDLCSHGILMVGMKLYQRGISLGQVMTFLIASPWNSLSLTVVLIALVGIPWTLLIILLSVIIAIISGRIFDHLVKLAILPPNKNALDEYQSHNLWRLIREELCGVKLSAAYLKRLVVDGLTGSRMVLRWLLFGIVLAAAIRTFIDIDTFQTLFGPTLAGLGLTLIAATVIEVCSEGSAPIAADLLKRGGAPGNAFTFLMAGVSTDYTEIMSIRDTSGSWKIALFLPLVTLPQILAISWLLNQ